MQLSHFCAKEMGIEVWLRRREGELLNHGYGKYLWAQEERRRAQEQICKGDPEGQSNREARNSVQSQGAREGPQTGRGKC